MGLFEMFKKEKGENKQSSIAPPSDNTLYIVEIPYETGEVHFRYSRKMSPDGTEWIRDGLFQDFYKNGNVGSEGFYVDGLEEGYWRDYHENGNLAAEGNYSKGEETGIWRYYDEDGNFEEEEDFG